MQRVPFALVGCLVLAACSESAKPAAPPPPPPPTVAIAVDAAPVVADAPAAGSDEPDDTRPTPCEPWSRSWPAGNHDRVVFLDEKTERFGYKDRAGTIVIPARFRDAGEFWPGGFAAVRPDADRVVDPRSPNEFIDPSGKTLAIAFQFDNGPDYYQDGFFRVWDPKRRKIGFMNDQGVVVIAPQFDTAFPFCGGVAKVTRGGTTSYIDTAGKPAKAPAPAP